MTDNFEQYYRKAIAAGATHRTMMENVADHINICRKYANSPATARFTNHTAGEWRECLVEAEEAQRLLKQRIANAPDQP